MEQDPKPAAPRPGGRSARVQAAVQAAVRTLQAQGGRDALTVPAVAAEAGVTPSTIYRRWGDLDTLLADVALERLRPEQPPADTGSLAGDLLAWALQYADEMGSPVGVGLVRDALRAQADGTPCGSVALTTGQIEQLFARAAARGEAVPGLDAVMDGVVAPVLYRALFAAAPPPAVLVRGWVAACLGLPVAALPRARRSRGN